MGCLKCSVCVIFLVTISFTAYGFEDLYLYDTDIGSHEPHLSIELLNSKLSHLHKRQTIQTNQTNQANQTTIADNRTNQKIPDLPLHTTSVPKLVNNNTTITTVENKNVTSNVSTHNLGENGAGICKYCNGTTTVTPPVLPAATKPNKDVIVAKNNQTDGDDDEISITKFANEDGALFNRTLEQNDINETRIDGHMYYNSTFTIDSLAGDHYWVDMENRSDVIMNELLSKSYRRASTIKLSFDFPFYGHLIRSITVATGGFLYTGEYVHSWLAATQYIAPLMANFDTSLSNNSFIKYVDNGTAFTVQWESVSLQDRPKDGQFTFQTTLYSNGDIVFVYKTVPLIIENIQDDHHPVKIGLSDAYIIDRTIFYVRRKTIYEYHRVQFKKEDIKNSSVIYLKALPTCLDHKDCDSCLNKEIDNFRCTWCWQINRCSNGLDRHRQDWLMKGCDRKQVTNGSMCYLPPTDDHESDGHEFYYGSNDTPSQANPSHKSNNTTDDKSLINRTLPYNVGNKQDTLSNTIQASRVATDSRVPANQSTAMGATGILTLLFLVAFVTGLGVWVLYAYRNPHTTSGQILIRYRPSQWRWKRGEARYTAATIHM